jgi:adenylate cyclase
MVANRRLAVIMMTDVVGYSRLMEADEVGTLTAMKELRGTILEPTVRSHEGRIVKLMGDGALMEFASAGNAVLAAIELQEKFSAASKALPKDRQIVLRIGINLGDIVGEGTDIFGHGVNVAARLEAQAPSGGILVSDAVHAQVPDKVRDKFAVAGELRLKNIATPMRAWRWTGSQAAAATVSTSRPNTKPTIAILPFTNIGDDPKQDFFAVGIRLDLETSLGLIRGIELLADSATAEFHLTGSVRAAADQIRVTARLTEAGGGKQLWNGRFDGREDDVFALQDEITRQVAVAMQVKLTSGDFARLWDGQTKSLAAWERCVVANQYHELWSEADNRRARDLLHEALHIDPDYLGAQMLLVKTLWYDARYYSHGDDREKALTEAERITNEVLAKRPDNAMATMFLGGVAWLCDRYDDAVAHCRRAASLSPSDPWVCGYFGLISVYVGDLQEALKVLERAAQLSPQPLTWIAYNIGHAKAWLNDDAGACASLRGYIADNPQDSWGYLMQAVIDGIAGRTEDARRAVAEALRRQADLNLDQVLRSNRYRDTARTKRLIEVLKAAGLPA